MSRLIELREGCAYDARDIRSIIAEADYQSRPTRYRVYAVCKMRAGFENHVIAEDLGGDAAEGMARELLSRVNDARAAQWPKDWSARHEFARAALAGLLADPNMNGDLRKITHDQFAESVAVSAVRYADAALAALEKPTQQG